MPRPATGQCLRAQLPQAKSIPSHRGLPEMNDPRIALITGASSDLGIAIAQNLTKAGLLILGLGRDAARLNQIAAECGDRFEPVVADLTHAADAEATREAVARHGRLDLLVLSSGIYERSQDPASLARQFNTNVQGPYVLLRSLLPFLVAARGTVIFINSTQGLTVSPGVDQYAATQHALRAIADGLRSEVNELGVRVTSIFLGRTATRRQAEIFALENRPYPPERLIQPADIAGLVLHLLDLPDTAEITDIKVRPRMKT
jgi:NADP-dependent 3-hydroxy acid dehydrogenase YdfG